MNGDNESNGQTDSSTVRSTADLFVNTGIDTTENVNQGGRSLRTCSARECIRQLLCGLGCYSEPLDHIPVQVVRPCRCWAMIMGLLLTGGGWVSHFVLQLMPMVEASNDECSRTARSKESLYNAKVLFVYFLFSVLTRCAILLPRTTLRMAVWQARTHDTWTSIHQIIRDVPAFVFAISAWLFYYHIACWGMVEQGCTSSRLYSFLEEFAIYSCILGSCGLVVAYWHSGVISKAAQEIVQLDLVKETLGIIDELEARAYDENVFGDAEGKEFPSECAICLGDWEADDDIRITPCRHAFHRECALNWMRTSRTCALCRQEISTRSDSRWMKERQERRTLASSSSESDVADNQRSQTQTPVPATTYGVVIEV